MRSSSEFGVNFRSTREIALGEKALRLRGEHRQVLHPRKHDDGELGLGRLAGREQHAARAAPSSSALTIARMIFLPDLFVVFSI